MFSFYYRGHETAIQRAAENNDWKKVTALYKIDPKKNSAELDDAICDGVMNNILHIRLVNGASPADPHFGDLESYLLRAFTMGPCTIKLPLLERLRDLPYFASDDMRHYLRALAATSVDIFTVLQVQNCDYDTALKYVNSGKEIPTLMDVLNATVLKSPTI